MTRLLLLSFILSFDSLLVSIPLGTLNLGRSTERKLAALFSFSDSLASLLGCLTGGVLLSAVGGLSERLGVWALCFYAGLVLLLAWGIQGGAFRRKGAKFFYALPFVLSLDNLAAGISLSKSGVPWGLSILMFGAASGLMAILGLRVGSFIGRHLPIPRVALASAGLLTMAALIAFR